MVEKNMRSKTYQEICESSFLDPSSAEYKQIAEYYNQTGPVHSAFYPIFIELTSKKVALGIFTQWTHNAKVNKADSRLYLPFRIPESFKQFLHKFEIIIVTYNQYPDVPPGFIRDKGFVATKTYFHHGEFNRKVTRRPKFTFAHVDALHYHCTLSLYDKYHAQ